MRLTTTADDRIVNHRRDSGNMTISPVAGIGSGNQQVQSPIAAAKAEAQAEAKEIPGAPDHDGDADDRPSTVPGSVNVKA
jgi:hypothetical protein